MIFNNTCIKCQKMFNNNISNNDLEPLVLGFNDTLICSKCLTNLYKKNLISEKRWLKSKFNQDLEASSSVKIYRLCEEDKKQEKSNLD